MKRRLLFSFVSAVLLILSSCAVKSVSEKSDDYPEKPDYFQEKSFYSEFKNSDGKVTYIVTAKYPYFTDGAMNELSKNVNADISNLVNNEKNKAEENVEYAGNYMSENNSEIPWKSEIDYEFCFVDSEKISFSILLKNSATGADVSPIYKGYNYSLKTGERIGINSILNPDESYTTVKEKVKENLNSQIVHKVKYTVDEDLLNSMVSDIFEVDSFVLIPTGRRFYINVTGYGLGIYGTVQVDV